MFACYVIKAIEKNKFWLLMTNAKYNLEFEKFKHSIKFFLHFIAGVIECYDLESGIWNTGDKYPQDIWEHTCVTLYIPRCRDDMEVMSNQRT